MKTATTLTAENRDSFGKGATRALRRAGKVPAVIYRSDIEPVALSIPQKDIKREYLLGGFFSKVITLNANGKEYHVLPKMVDLHPVNDAIQHADFMLADEKTKIRALVPVKFSGRERCAGIRRGGSLNVVRHDLELECYPQDIPAFVSVDLKDLNIGDSVHISHIELPDGVVSTITDRDFTIATIAGRVSRETKEAEAGEESEEGTEGETEE